MSKRVWQVHAEAVGYFNMTVDERRAHVASGSTFSAGQPCAACKARRDQKRRNASAKVRGDVYRSLGMTRTSGGWE